MDRSFDTATTREHNLAPNLSKNRHFSALLYLCLSFASSFGGGGRTALQKVGEVCSLIKKLARHTLQAIQSVSSIK
jgi:hypothetical protein